MHVRATELAAWMRERASAAGASGLVVSLDAGLDSAVVLGLAWMAMPGAVVGVLLPCHAHPEGLPDARAVADHFDVPALRVDLAPAYAHVSSALEGAAAGLRTAPERPADPEDGEASLRAVRRDLEQRLRMASLHYLAASLNCLVVGPTNRCDLTVGLFTRYGDTAADLLPLAGLLKSDVRALAADLAIPPPLLERAHGFDMREGRPEDPELAISDVHLERYLSDGPDAVPPAVALRIERLARRSARKNAPPETPGDRIEP